jgi:hypothetical protein
LKPSDAYIGSKPLSIARKRYRNIPEKKHNKGWKRYMIELLYLISNTVYVSIYFYFLPFLVTIYPMFIHGFEKDYQKAQ